MDTQLDVDEIWKNLGTWGRYQKFQLFILFMDGMATAFHLLSTVVIGYRYPFECKEVSYNCSNLDEAACSDNITYLEHGKCSVKTYNNYTNLTTTESCVNGYDYHVPKDRTFVTEWDLVCDGSELGEFTQTLVIIGQATGAAVTTQFADRFGRKPVHVLSHIALFGIALAMAFAPNLTVFSVLRYLIGTFQQGIVITNVVMSMEILPRKSRVKGLIIEGFAWTTGVALLAPLGYLFQDLSWRYLQMTLALYSVYSLSLYWVLDESLRWLLANGKFKEAEKITRKAARWNKANFDDVVKAATIPTERNDISGSSISLPTVSSQVDDGSVQIQNGISIYTVSTGDLCSGNSEQKTGNSNVMKNEDVKRYTLLTILKTRKVLINSFILWYIWIVDNLTYYGIALMSYTLSGNRFLNFFLTAIMDYPAKFSTYFLANRIGRKRLVIFYHVITGVACLTATALLTLADGNTHMLTASTAFTMIAKYGSSGSFGSVFLYTPEVYPTNLRNAGLGVSSSISRIGGMLAPFAGPLAVRVKWAPGTIFGIMCVLVVVVCLKLPETTKHRLPQTLEDIDKWKEERNTGDIEYSIRK